MNRIVLNLRADHLPAIAGAAASVTIEICIRGDLFDAARIAHASLSATIFEFLLLEQAVLCLNSASLSKRKVRRRVHTEGEYELRTMSGAPCGEPPLVSRGNLLANRKA
jgi:hypothetical protein